MIVRMRKRGERVVRWPLVLLFLLFAKLPAGAQEPVISVDVNLVMLQASVHDHRGHDVVNLRKEDFTLEENGVPQTIRLFQREDAPVTVGLIVDHSGSMEEKLGEVIAAARTFVQSSNPKDEMFVLNFNEKVVSGLVNKPFSDDPVELESAVASTPPVGETALYDAIAAGLEKLDTGHWDKKVLLVISDGGDNASRRTLADVTTMAERSSATIYTIGLFAPYDRDANPGVLKRLAETTGGEAFFPKQFDQIAEICHHIAGDIRSQYSIGYVSSSGAADDSYRTIRLLAATPGMGKLHVRTRRGYIARGSVK